MKKIYLFAISNLFTPVAFADAGTSGISDAADGVVTYMPYVRALCYVIAAIIAVVGALAVYYTMQTNPQNTAKRMTMTVGGVLTFVCLSLALPQFFGIDGKELPFADGLDAHDLCGGDIDLCVASETEVVVLREIAQPEETCQQQDDDGDGGSQFDIGANLHNAIVS